ncbi:MAG: hypothetical protein QXD42_06610 [Nitrososphaerales archaeon]
MSRSSYQVRAYNVNHGYEVSNFLEMYRLMLQRAVDEIWDRIRWVKKFDRLGGAGSSQSYLKMERSRTIT